MAVAFAADIHLGNHLRFGGKSVRGVNDRARMVAETIRRAHDGHADEFIVLGDVFDTDRPSPQIVALAQRSLSGSHVVPGNHDATALGPEGYNALEPLERSGVVVHDHPCLIETSVGGVLVNIVLIPRVATADELYVAIIDQLHKHRHAVERRPTAIGIHAGIKDADTPPWLRNASDAIDVHRLVGICRAHNVQAVFAGDWHERRRWALDAHAIDIVQVGSLCPTGFDDQTWDHGITLWDPNREPGSRVRFVDIPGPRFVSVSTADELTSAARLARQRRCKLFVSWSSTNDYLEVVKELDGEEAMASVVGFVSVPDLSAPRQAAAEAARASTSLGEAVVAFVDRMPLPDGVARDRVGLRARGYLGV